MSEEKIADIVREMASPRDTVDIDALADRIEAAEKQTRTDLDAARAAIASLEEELERLHAPGNAAALREALEDTNRLLKHFAERIPMFADAFAQHIRDNDAALKGETK